MPHKVIRNFTQFKNGSWRPFSGRQDLYVSGSGLITSVEEERANLSAVAYL